MSTQSRTLKVKLFLEGVEVDCISVQVSGGINAPASAAIQIPYADAAHELLPRTLVHVFYYVNSSQDLRVVEGLGTTVYAGRNVTASPNDMRSWRLLFAGEVLGYSFQKEGGSRHISLSCQDFSSYWQQAQIYWGTGKTSYTSFKRAVFAGATHLYQGKKKVNTTGKLIKLLRAAPATNPTLPGLLGGIVSLLESTTGVYDNASARRWRGVNDFMSQAELRLHLTKMIGASPKDDTSAVFLNSRAFRRYLAKVGASVKRTSSYMQLIQIFLGRCYHRWTSVPAPPYRRGGEVIFTKLVVPSGIKYNGSEEAARLYKQIKDTRDILGGESLRALKVAEERKEKFKRAKFSGRINEGEADHLRFGVDLPKVGEVNTQSGQHDKIATEIAHVGFTGQSKKKLLDFGHSLRTDVQKKVKGFSSSQRAAALKRASSFASGLEKAAHALPLLEDALTSVGGKDPYPSYTVKNVVGAQRYLEAALDTMAKSLKKPVRTIRKKAILEERLHMFLFTPDIFMVPPPRCNVLFPDQYTSLTFARGWMSEITRLWLHTTTVYGRDRKDIYFAPNTSILNGPSAKMAEEMIKKSTSILMNHEIYTGIIPSIEAIGDASIFKRLHKRAVKDAKASGLKREKTSGQAAHSPQEHMARTANFMFFSKRLAGRTMRVSCRYSPQLVPGLPCLVLDPVLSDTSTGNTSGTHYIGTIARINHVLDSSGGGITTIDLVKCRAHNEGVDIFSKDVEGGVATAEKSYPTVRKKKLPEALKKHTGYGQGQSRPPPAPVDLYYKQDKRSLLTDGTQKTASHPAGALGFFVKHRDAKRPGLEHYAPNAKGTVNDVVNFKKDPNKKYVIKTRTNYPAEILDASKTKQAGWGDKGDPNRRNTRTYRTFTVPGAKTPGLSPAKDQSYIYVDIYEITRSRRDVKVSFDFESTATPAWFSPIYRADRIGSDFYQYMIGCNSVIDQAALARGKITENDTVEMHIRKSINGKVVTTRVELPLNVVQPPGNTHQAAEALAKTWVTLKENGADVDLYISQYTGRNFASMLDVMGNMNPALQILAKEQFTGGTEQTDGFHGFAYGPYENFTDWDGVPLLDEPLFEMAKKGDQRGLSAKADPRKERYLQVVAYGTELRTRGKRAGAPENDGRAA